MKRLHRCTEQIFIPFNPLIASGQNLINNHLFYQISYTVEIQETENQNSEKPTMNIQKTEDQIFEESNLYYIKPERYRGIKNTH